MRLEVVLFFHQEYFIGVFSCVHKYTQEVKVDHLDLTH